MCAEVLGLKLLGVRKSSEMHHVVFMPMGSRGKRMRAEVLGLKLLGVRKPNGLHG